MKQTAQRSQLVLSLADLSRVTASVRKLKSVDIAYKPKLPIKQNSVNVLQLEHRKSVVSSPIRHILNTDSTSVLRTEQSEIYTNNSRKIPM